MGGDPLRMISGGDRDHAPRSLVRREALELYQRASVLERAGALERLKLDEDVRRVLLRQAPGPDDVSVQPRLLG